MADSTPPPRTVRPGGNTTTKPPQDRTIQMPVGGSSKRANTFKELLGIPMLGLGFKAAIDQVRQPDAISPYAMDVWTVSMYADPLAEAVADMADSYPVIGTVLDRIGTVTPFMQLATVLLAVGTQIAENHGKLPPGMDASNPNLIKREDLAQQIHAEAMARKNGDG